MEPEALKSSIFNGLSTVMKALSHPSRLELVELLAQGERSVEALADATGMSIANASQHLQHLKKSRLVISRKEGHFVFYALINLQFLAMYRHFTAYATSETGELKWLIDQQREELGTRDSVEVEELPSLILNDKIHLVDLRTTNEFDLGHIPGAISIPFDQLPQRLHSLSTQKEVIVYCRGAICFLADEAVKILRENGFQARRCAVGYPEGNPKELT